ncbi:MAG: hypothetical protein AB4368_31600 [Xenococcaceae cyanobacterium]
MKNLVIRIAWVVSVVFSLVQMSKQVADACQPAEQYSKSQLLIAQNISLCQQLKKEYQEVHSFETQNFYINVCRYKQKYYYHRKSKHNPNQIILLPANTILNGNMFRASDQGTTYIVGTSPEGYYSSVMYENNEIILEPELKSSALVNDSIELNTESFDNSQNKWLKCLQGYGHASMDYS